MADLQDIHRPAYPARGVGGVVPVHPQAEGEVLFHRHMRVKRVGLEHHRNAPVGRFLVINDPSADRHLPARDTLKPGDHAQQRGLAAARRPHKDAELAGCDLKIDPVDYLSGTIALADVPQRKFGHRMALILWHQRRCPIRNGAAG